MKRTIHKTVILLGGVLTLLVTTNLFPTAQGGLYPEENVDKVHTRITAIGVSIPDETALESWGYNITGSALFQLSLNYELWNAGRDVASFETGCWDELEDIIPLAYSWDTDHIVEIQSRRNILITCSPLVRTFEFDPGITTGTAKFYLNVTDWTSDTLPIGNYTFHVGRTTWQERLPATLHIESNRTWTEFTDLPEGWGIEKSIPGYPLILFGIGILMIVGLWEWTRKQVFG